MSQIKLVTVIEADKVISLADGGYYRYISPDPTTQTSGLAGFYGQDRSFTAEYIFDTADFVVKFHMTQDTPVMPVQHHKNCFRGPLTVENTQILALFVRTPGLDFEQDFIQQQFQLILNDMPHGSLIYSVSEYTTDCEVAITKIAKVIKY